MRKYGVMLTAVMMAVMITACGDGDGIVINGTTAAETESGQTEEKGSQDGGETTKSQESQNSGGAKIEIITGESQYREETAAQSLEGQTEPETTMPETEAQTQPASTTAAPTTAAPATKAPTKAPETTAARTYEVTALNKTMYASASVRVRESYSTSSEVLGGLAEGEKIEITGESANGWMRVNYKGHVAYVSKSYLTDTPPATQSAGAQTGRPTSTTDQGTTPGGSTGTNGAAGPGGSTGTNGAAGPGGTASSGGAAGPGGSTSSGGTAGPGGSTSSGGTAGPGGSTSSGGTAGPGGSTSSGGTSSGSITGTVTQFDPSYIVIQSSDGSTHQFSHGGTIGASGIYSGVKVQVQYSTDASGQKAATKVDVVQ